jgi:hypothetical protein
MGDHSAVLIRSVVEVGNVRRRVEKRERRVERFSE